MIYPNFKTNQNTMMKLVLPIALLFINCFFAKGQNSYENSLLVAEVLQQLKLEKKDIKTELFAEKILPDNPSQSVLVIPKIISNEAGIDNNFSYNLDAYILIVENSSGKIINKYFESEAWISDAVMLTSIEIDTAPYLLQSNNRAFGVIVNYTGSSRPNPYSRSDLTLFTANGKSLKPLLKNYLLAKSVGEWDTNCAGEFEDMHSILIIDKQKSNNLNNLIVKQTITKTKNFVTNDDCDEKETKTQKKLVLKFNKKEYK